MAEYNQLHYNVDTWYDSIDDVHAHARDDKGESYPRFHQYMYAYLSCIEEFSNDVEWVYYYPCNHWDDWIVLNCNGISTS